MDYRYFHFDLKPQQPDTTQRSIIAEARKSLERMEVTGDVVSIYVHREMQILTIEEALDGPQDWHKSNYVVDFRRTATGWEPTTIR
jgi:hypothetical protein